MGVTVKVLALCVGQRSVFSWPTPSAGPGLLAAGQGGLDGSWEDVRLALVWLLWLADPCWPRGGGRWGYTSHVDGPRQRQHLGQEMTDTAEELGLRTHQVWAAISDLLLSSCEILDKSPMTLLSLSVLLCKMGHTS